jgi:predicted enzyme related to lactoylglutathione lyase
MTTPGAFSWIALTTSDAEAASSFYARLFGWSTIQGPVGSIFLGKNSAPVGTLIPHGDSFFAKEPLNWFPFVRVDDIESAVARVVEAGGSLWTTPYSVGPARVAIVRGATREAFGLWQTPVPDGEPLVSEPGTCAWYELATREPEVAIPFYQSVFGWSIADEGGYTFIGNENGQFGGIVKLEGDWEDHAFMKAIGRARGAKLEVPPHWMVFFSVDDCESFADEVESFGGTVTQRPEPLHTVGTFAVLRDPLGAYFSVLSKR